MRRLARAYATVELRPRSVPHAASRAQARSHSSSIDEAPRARGPMRATTTDELQIVRHEEDHVRDGQPQGLGDREAAAKRVTATRYHSRPAATPTWHARPRGQYW